MSVGGCLTWSRSEFALYDSGAVILGGEEVIGVSSYAARPTSTCRSRNIDIGVEICRHGAGAGLCHDERLGSGKGRITTAASTTSDIKANARNSRRCED